LLCRHLWHWCVCGSRGCFCLRHCLRFCLCFGRRCCCALCCFWLCLSCRAPAFFRGRRGLAKVRGSGLGGFENTTGLGYLLQLYISNLINHRPVFVLEPLPGVQTLSPGIKWPDRCCGSNIHRRCFRQGSRLEPRDGSKTNRAVVVYIFKWPVVLGPTLPLEGNTSGPANSIFWTSSRAGQNLPGLR